jgi:hypothetical protein
MNDVTYDPLSNLASLQLGLRLGDVRKRRLDYSVCVTSGCDGNVGIGGFLTGGGNSYYAGLYESYWAGLYEGASFSGVEGLLEPPMRTFTTQQQHDHIF